MFTKKNMQIYKNYGKICEKLQIITKKDNDFNKISKKIYIFSMKWNKTRTNHQEKLYNHMKNINIHIKIF